MIANWKLAALAALVSVGIASPAFAQRHYHRYGLYNYYVGQPSGGYYGSFGPAARGGGSLGYNENLRIDH